MKVYDELLDFLTSGPTLDEIIAFELSPATQKRARYLMKRSAEGRLTDAEQQELQEFNRIDDFMDKVKIRARRRLQG